MRSGFFFVWYILGYNSSMRKILTGKFFNRPTLIVARELLGKYLVRRIDRKEVALKINEVESYDGPRDCASHAARGRTARNSVMFGEAGVWYVYFTYGMHWMLNIVTGKEGYPAAILIRGAGNINGPAKLTKFLQIDKRLNGKISERTTGLWIEDRPHTAKAKRGKGEKISENQIMKMPRVGVAYAGPIWSQKPYRFIIGEKKKPSP